VQEKAVSDQTHRFGTGISSAIHFSRRTFSKDCKRRSKLGTEDPEEVVRREVETLDSDWDRTTGASAAG
jgi:hypothetical protein